MCRLMSCRLVAILKVTVHINYFFAKKYSFNVFNNYENCMKNYIIELFCKLRCSYILYFVNLSSFICTAESADPSTLEGRHNRA